MFSSLLQCLLILMKAQDDAARVGEQKPEIVPTVPGCGFGESAPFSKLSAILVRVWRLVWWLLSLQRFAGEPVHL